MNQASARFVLGALTTIALLACSSSDSASPPPAAEGQAGGGGGGGGQTADAGRAGTAGTAGAPSGGAGTGGSTGGAGAAGAGGSTAGAAGTGGAAAGSGGASGGMAGAGTAGMGGATSGGAGGATTGGAGGATSGAGGASTGGAGGSVAGSGGSAGAPVQTVSVSGTVYSNEDGNPIPDATVTVVDGAPTTTMPVDSSGGWMLTLPVGATIYLRADAPNFAPLVRGLVVPANGAIRDYYLPATSTYDAWSAAATSPFDASKGTVWVSFENATVAGYSATLSASHDPSMTLDPNTMMPAIADATLSGGVDYWFLVYPNVDPTSTTTIVLNSPAGHDCTPREAITDWKLFPGATTYVDADCN